MVFRALATWGIEVSLMLPVSYIEKQNDGIVDS